MDLAFYMKRKLKKIGVVIAILVGITAFFDVFASFFILWELLRIRRGVT